MLHDLIDLVAFNFVDAISPNSENAAWFQDPIHFREKTIQIKPYGGVLWTKIGITFRETREMIFERGAHSIYGYKPRNFFASTTRLMPKERAAKRMGIFSFRLMVKVCRKAPSRMRFNLSRTS